MWVKTHYNGKKIIVTKIIFWNYVVLNFYQANIKRVFYKWYLE
jgi:hypothetical protein